QFPIGTYKKAHAHGPGAHVIVLSGEGFSLMWPEGEEPKRYDWREGTMIVPPNMWFHQHFNTGTTPARYLAFKAEGVAVRNPQAVSLAVSCRARHVLSSRSSLCTSCSAGTIAATVSSTTKITSLILIICAPSRSALAARFTLIAS